MGTEPGMFGFTNPGPITLSDEELSELILCVHMAQDMWHAASDDLATSESAGDQETSREFDRRLDLLEVVRKKLGDEWEPIKAYKTPDDASELSNPNSTTDPNTEGA